MSKLTNISDYVENIHFLLGETFVTNFAILVYLEVIKKVPWIKISEDIHNAMKQYLVDVNGITLGGLAEASVEYAMENLKDFEDFLELEENGESEEEEGDEAEDEDQEEED